MPMSAELTKKRANETVYDRWRDRYIEVMEKNIEKLTEEVAGLRGEVALLAEEVRDLKRIPAVPPQPVKYAFPDRKNLDEMIGNYVPIFSIFVLLGFMTLLFIVAIIKIIFT